MKKPFSPFFPALIAASALSFGASAAFAQASAPAAAAPASAAAPVAGNVAAGEKKAAMCIGCHGIEGYQASFPEVHKVPMIGGQSAKYLKTALLGYQKGSRRHPTMKAIAASLTEQDINDLSAFYEQQNVHGAAKGTVAAPESPRVGELLKACVACHGADFNTPNADQPKLAGQHADYLYVSLKSYQVSKSPQVGRADGTMQAQVSGMSHADLKAISKYLASLKTDLTVKPQSRFR